MTTGNTGPPTRGPYDLNTSLLKRRVWSGGDGKYTTFAGTQKTKWNNFTCVAEEWLVSSVSFQSKWWSVTNMPSDGQITWHTRNDSVGFGWKAAETWGSNDQLKLLSRLLEKVKGHDFNLAVNLGQMHQTVDMLATNLQKLGTAALALKRGNFAAAARQLGARPRGTRLKTTDVSGRWLELQYGWLPLIGDSFEAAKAFEAISNGPRSQIYRASNKKPAVQKNGSQNDFFVIPYKESLVKFVQYELAEEMSFARQLGLLDPLSVAWELMPWSFVIDWFIPIGSYLDLVNQIPSLKGRFLETLVNKRQATVDKPALTKAFFDTLGQGYFGWKPNGVTAIPSVYHKRTEVTRTYSTSLSVPLPSMDFSGAIHGRRLWNAISLAQQRFARVFRV